MSEQTSLTPEDGVLINARQLRERIPVSTMTIRRYERDPKIGFPKRIKLNGGMNYWRLSEVQEWIDRRALAQNEAAAAEANTTNEEEPVP